MINVLPLSFRNPIILLQPKLLKLVKIKSNSNLSSRLNNHNSNNRQRKKPNRNSEEIGSSLVLLKSAITSIRGLDPSEIPAECTPEDVMEPDNAEKNKCYAYLQELTKQLRKRKTTNDRRIWKCL